ncbi:MAG: carbohydrate ABC transporter substrate-binding protein [Clostridia bacterium]|nr:carbohydrate ABC transporter substrate-binding protein [Clostridia bacterium]
MKYFKLTAVTLLFAVLLISCGVSSEIVPEYDVTSDTTDFYGTTFNWGFSMHRYASSTDNVFGYKPDTNFADMALERLKDVEKRFNCTINIDNNSSSYVIGDRLNVSLKTGVHLYDIATCDTGILSSIVRAGGYLAGLSNLLDVKNTAKFGRPNMLQMMLWKDDLYGVVPCAWPLLVSSRIGHVLAINETLVARLGETDPREYVENSTWTWDKFEEVLEAFTYKEGERTVYGLSSHDAYFAMNMFLSNGVTFSEYVDGKVVFGAYTDAGREALERAASIYNVTCKPFIYPDASTTDHFRDGSSVMCGYFLDGVINTLMYEMENAGIIPFPQGPKATPGVYPTYYEEFTYATVIPANAIDTSASAAIIDAMFEPFKGLETRDDMIDYLTSQVFFDPRDSAVFLGAVEYTEYGFFWEGGRSGIEQCIRTLKPVSEALEGLENVYDKLVEEYLVPHYNGRIAVYGE